MGCNNSKSTETQDQQGKDKPKQQEEGGDDSVTVDFATKYLVKEVGLSEEAAKHIIDRCNKDGDGNIANKELQDLWNQIQEAQNELEPEFKKYDKDNNGHVTRDDCMTIFKKKFKGVDEKHLEAMAKRCDKDGNGQVNYSEFVVFYSRAKAMKTKMPERFQILDKDGSGDLTADELATELECTCAMDKKMARCLVEDFDANKDGKINRKEFEEMYAKLFA